MQEVTPESKQELIIKAQQVYKFSVANAGKARLSASENTSRDIDVSLLFPDWDKNGMVQNSKGQNVLGVFLKKTNKEYWEANFLFIGGASVLIIKKFTFKDNCLTIYNSSGKFLGKGVYDPETKIFDMFLTRQELSKQARISGEGKTRRKKKVDVKAGTETRYDVTITLYVGSGGGGGFNIGDATSISVEGYDDEEGDDDENSEGNDDPFQNMDNGEEGFEIPDGSIVGGTETLSESNEYNYRHIDKNPCYSEEVKSIVNAALNTVMGDIVGTYDGDNESRIHFGLFEHPSYNLDASTDTYGKNGLVYLNTTALGNADDAYLTGTVLHEILHVYTPGGNDEDHKTWLNNSDGKGSFDKLVSAIVKIAGISEEEARALAMFGVKDKLTPEEDKINEKHKKGHTKNRNANDCK
ncbi:MAG: hypothetical protein ACOVOW_16665 [Spirosomataceae bacterium]